MTSPGGASSPPPRRFALPTERAARLIAFTRLACLATALIVWFQPSGTERDILFHSGLLLLCTGLFASAALTVTARATGSSRLVFMGLSGTAIVALLAVLTDALSALGGRPRHFPTPGLWIALVGGHASLVLSFAATIGWRSRLLRVAVADTLLLVTAAAMVGISLSSIWMARPGNVLPLSVAPYMVLLRVLPTTELLLLAAIIATRGGALGWRTTSGVALGTSVLAVGTMLLGRFTAASAPAAAVAYDLLAALTLLAFAGALEVPSAAPVKQTRRDDVPAQRLRARFLVIATLLAASAVLLIGFRGQPMRELSVAVAVFVALLAGRVGHVLSLRERQTIALSSSVTAERELSSLLEQRVAARTAELAEAQRVLQRMWTLGQQITTELDPARVLKHFVEAAVDVAKTDGAALGLMNEDGRIRLVAAIGIAEELDGSAFPIEDSVMGHVIRSGKSWRAPDVSQSGERLAIPSLVSGDRPARGIAVVPIARRGERIGALALVARAPRTFTDTEIARVESMGDMLSVALANAELVDNLRKAEWRFRTLFRAAPDAVLTVLNSGRIREANEAVRDIVGLDAMQVVGRRLVDLAADEDHNALEQALDSASRGQPARLEVRFTSGGVTRLVAISASRLPESDPPATLLIARDITTEREMRARLIERERLVAIGELVAGVAHEVNNPLSSISAYAQILLREPDLSDAHREAMEVIRSETTRASQVVKDLLAFARRSEPRREAVDLQEVVESAVRLSHYQLISGKLRTAIEIPADLPAVMGDPRQLQQVVINLVTNAMQAMASQGTGTLRIEARAEHSTVVLEVADTGSGISAAARSRIFEPFFTTKEEGQGTGLGLSVTYGIVTAHGGTIVVVDSTPAGSRFRVTLPAISERREPDEPPPPAAPTRSALAGIRLLFVDDEPALRRGMVAFGTLRGFTVATALDGTEALAAVQETSFDAVVCDLRMPGMDGIAFHAALALERPGLAQRTVFITGDMLGSTAREAAATRQPMLHKPFAFERLEEALVTVLRGRQPVPAWEADVER